MAYNLEQMAHEAGIKVSKLMAVIEPTAVLEDELYAVLWPIIDSYRRQFGYVEAAWTDTLTVRGVEAILATTAAPAAALLAAVEPDVEQWATRVEQWHRQRWRGVVRGAVRLDIGPLLEIEPIRKALEVSTKNNVALITKLNADVYARIEQQMWSSYRAGTNSRTLAKQLRADFEFAKPRALLIAQDQTAKYADALDEARAAEAGLEFYKWRDMGDGVVRPTHKANNGKTFRNDTPPPKTGHPGHEPRCRCKRRMVVLSDSEEAMLQAEGLEV